MEFKRLNFRTWLKEAETRISEGNGEDLFATLDIGEQAALAAERPLEIKNTLPEAPQTLDYQAITTEAAFAELLARLDMAEAIGLDTETTSLDAMQARGITLKMVNLGGGFPTKYLKEVPGTGSYANAIHEALTKHFGNAIPETIIEPGRGMVGNAGIIEAEVVLISKKSEYDTVKWVYLDIGKFNGLAETMDEMIRYPIRTEFDGDELEPCVLAGPTCDSVDVLYEKDPYFLPVSLEIGTRVLIEGTGAYTTTYSAVGFNGFPPLETFII